MSPGETPIPCVVLQPDGQVRRSAGDRARSRRRRARHRPLHPQPAERRAPGALPSGRQPTATRAISCSPPRRQQIDYLRFPLGGMAKPEVRAIAAELGLAVADKQDSQDICFVPQGTLFRHHRQAEADGGARPARSCISTAACSAATRASCTTRSASAAASASPRASRSMSCISTPTDARVDRRAARGAGNAPGLSARPQLAGRRGPRRESARPASSVFAKVRSTRPPRPATLHRRDGATFVELADGESGVAPGQACVLYDDDGNAARVLGGGFIARSERGAEAEAMLSRLSRSRHRPSPRTDGPSRTLFDDYLCDRARRAPGQLPGQQASSRFSRE